MEESNANMVLKTGLRRALSKGQLHPRHRHGPPAAPPPLPPPAALHRSAPATAAWRRLLPSRRRCRRLPPHPAAVAFALLLLPQATRLRRSALCWSARPSSLGT